MDSNLRRAIDTLASECSTSGEHTLGVISDVLKAIIRHADELDKQEELRHNKIMSEIGNVS